VSLELIKLIVVAFRDRLLENRHIRFVLVYVLLELLGRHRHLAVWTPADVLTTVSIVELERLLSDHLATVVALDLGVLGAPCDKCALRVISLLLLSLSLHVLSSLRRTLRDLLLEFNVLFLQFRYLFHGLSQLVFELLVLCFEE